MSELKLSILHIDDDIVVVDKPHGLLSVPGLGPANRDCVASRVCETIPDALIVHRLDCHTSGVMLLARGKSNQAALSKQFHDRITQKAYIAVVEGEPELQYGEIDQPMRCDVDNRPRQIIDHEHGKHALTRWQKLQVDDGRSRLLLRPVTGRSHQLRVHCAWLGTPIVGDRLYGLDGGEGESRMLLHAHVLSFRHPRDERWVTMQADCTF